MAGLSRNGKAALNYAKNSWAVFPLHTPTVKGGCSCGRPDCTDIGKHPRTANGVKDASTDPGIINAWWQRWPDANIGIATGRRSGIIVVDLDTRKNGLGNWADMLDIKGAAATLTSITGSGGQHWIFKAPADVLLANSAGKLAAGIDTRGEGGYIVAPPSLHATGNRYSWDSKTAPAEVMPWLLETWPRFSPNGTQVFAVPRPIHSGEFDTWVSDALANGAPAGERNTTATRLAGYFRSKGLPRDVIVELLGQFAGKCNPPMHLPELLRTIDSVNRYQVHVTEAGVSDPPLFSERAGQLIYTWEKPGVSITLEQVSFNKTGLHSLISIRSALEGGRKVHGPVKYDLLSTTGRETLIKYLKNRWEVNWPEILESLTDLVKARLDLGDAPVNLLEYMNRPASKWALWPLILDDQPTIVFGNGGTGKSLLALAAMLTLETEYPYLPGLEPAAGHHGLYLDWEASSYEHGERLNGLLTGLPSKQTLAHQTVEVLHLSCAGVMANMVTQIKRQVDDRGVTFLIIDSAGLACGYEPEKSEMALGFFGALREIGLPALIIAHQTKGDSRGMPFGSIYWHNAARSTWEVKKYQAPGDHILQVGLFHRKSNVGGLIRPLGFSFKFDSRSTPFMETNKGIGIERVDVLDVPELAESSHTVDRIAGALRGGAMTVKEIHETTGIKEDTIRKTLDRHQGKRFIEAGTNLGVIKWGLGYE